MARLGKGQNRAVNLARRELGRLWMELEGLPPARQRDMLLDLLPALCRKYGDIGSVAAAQWYDELWRRWFDGDFEAQAVNGFDDEAMRGVIRANTGLLFDKPDSTTADPDQFLRWANKFLDRNVKEPGRLTIQANVRRDPHKPGYARRAIRADDVPVLPHAGGTRLHLRQRGHRRSRP
ncbi:VG15 protein [Bifidobacterium bifidum]|uniref:VG15 protein n=1 Tax=Bifidobacterium bifidum TaxID=1681 RepID=UPI0040447C14